MYGYARVSAQDQNVEHLCEKGVNFAVLNLGINTRTPTGKFFLTVMLDFSELDREMIKEKQIAGIKLIKQKGVYRGRVKKFKYSSFLIVIKS
ncbi:hypothetical protein COL72_27615 [Bacillus toyonensis]|nr:hypothetical protein COL72_27615 [Bacillus toyonensis]